MTDGDLFLYFCGSTFLTFSIAAVVLAFFAKDRTSRFAGYIVMKPIIVYVTSSVTWYFYPWWSTDLDWTPWFIIHFLVEFILLLAIIYWFRDLIKISTRFLLLFVVLDFLRWGSVLFFILTSALRWVVNMNLSIFILFYFPIFNTILALFFSFVQRSKSQVVQNTN